jgi:hypothetical protein
MVVKINEMRCFIPMNLTVRILRLSFSVTCFDFSLHKGFVNIHTIFFQKHNYVSGGNKILTLVLTCHEKKFINSDGQQYHQYQQNECTYLSPQIINKKTKPQYRDTVNIGYTRHRTETNKQKTQKFLFMTG